MKKLLLFILISCLYATTEAASVVWNSSYKITDSTGSVISSAEDFTSLMNGGSLVLVLLQDGTYSGSISTLGGTAKFKTSPNPQKGKITGTYNFEYTANVLKNGDILGVMFKDASGNLSQLVYTDGTSMNDTFVISGLTDNIFSTNFNYGANGNFTVVPEPTSGLLLLFGLAGLALRRKQA